MSVLLQHVMVLMLTTTAMTKATIEQQLFDKLERLMVVVDSLKRRIESLEQNQRVTQPYQPFGIPIPPITQPFQWPVDSCTKCGLKLDKVMSYCCSVPNCPTGLGPVMCDTGTAP